MGTCCSGGHGTGVSYEEFIYAMGSTVGDAALSGVVAGLTKLAEDHPYLKPTGTEFAPHPLLYWVRRCREFALAKKTQEAEGCLERVLNSLEYELAQIRDAFRRFDHDDSKQLDTQEFKLMCAYIGWGTEEAMVMDLDHDQKVSLEEFERFVGHMGGLQQVFQQRRQRVARKQWGVDAPSIIEVGARVQSYHYMQDGEKSKGLREAQVLELNVMPSNGVRLVFGFGEGRDAYQEQQVVPPNWIFSDTHDSDVVAALREVGILEEQQGFWASIFPQSEMRAVQRLTACQRAALSNVRSNASLNHDKALPEVRERFTRLGYGEAEVQGVLGWIQDLAPMCIHIHIDDVGRFLETDEFYRSQFETGTSCGALDDKNQIRKDWETDLFGGAYDDAKAFERCKYGALGVMNDYRGITSAYQYGDSYLVLKDVRLRATFAATDSGGIQGSRLAVLDKYAHVLKEYNDNELHRLVEVAMANTSMEDVPRMQPRLLRGLTADTTNDWVTMGFPDLPQKKGRYFFEVELHFGVESPQVGLLASRFELAPRTKGLHLLGVGDDQHGWGADGQHSILWHGGRKMAWNRTWKTSGRQLSEQVVVSVAVDIEAGKIWFATNGEWDSEAEPSFGPAVVPRSAAMYPAVSFKGRAAFNFGPEFKHDPPKFSKAFAAWPGMPDGKLRADCPIIGNSNNVAIYKEIQIHGEVSLKRNVQRLVANRKHLEMSKSDRTWAICVDGLGSADGTYDRVGAKNGKAWYKQQDGNCHQILFDADAEKWKIIHQDAPELWLADAPPVKNSFEPPRHQWSVPSTKRGRMPVSLFKTACADAKISSEVQDHICQALGKKSAGSSEMDIFRIDEDTSFEDEWTKLQRENKVQMTAEDFWALCVKKKHEEILAGKKLKDLQVVESPHPYPAKTHSWTKDIYLPNASKLRVSFDPRCATLDDCTTFRAFSGGLSKSLAGVGARAHLKAISGVDQVHGTMAGQAEGGKWIVNIDHDESEICGCFREWLDAAEGRHCTATCAQEKKVIRVKYTESLGEEIAGFTFNEACPLSPFSISGFANPGGPAQMKGVFTGWFIDVIHLIKQKPFKDLKDEEYGPVPKNLTEIAENIEGFKKRLEALREVKNINVTFYNGLDFQLLPICQVTYKGKISEEISGMMSQGGTLVLGDLSGNGPAKEAGVRSGWHVSLHETFKRDENKRALQDLTPQQVLEDPERLRQLAGITLMLEPANAEPQEFFCGKETSGWTDFVMPSNTGQFVFQSDGDGGDSPDERWGVFAVITSAADPAPSQQVISELADAYAEADRSIVGFSAKGVSVEPEDWDEARLKALCARHGWEFEWMTEDGERQRRIEGAARARKEAKEGQDVNSKATRSQLPGWWRLDSMAKAFTFQAQDQQQKRKIAPPPQFKPKS